MYRLLVMKPCDENQREKLVKAAGGNYVIKYYDKIKDNISEVVKEAEVIIGEPPLELIRNSENLMWVQMTIAGTDIYTANKGFPENVRLTNMSGAFGTVISEYVIGAVLMMYRNFPKYINNQQTAVWMDAGRERTLAGKRVLILGAGDIGCNIAKRIKVFGTTISGIRRVKRDKPDFFDEMHTMDELDNELAKADIVIGCLPNTNDTRGILDKERFLNMREDALLINVGRGTLIVTDDLVEVMREGHLSGAVLDVFEQEPLPPSSPLWKMANVMITPHISGKSFGHNKETENYIYNICCENLKRFALGRELLNNVDFNTGYRKTQYENLY